MIEKKLKKAADEIKMSDELKERIAAKCRNTEIEKHDPAVEQVSGVEQYKPRSIIRIVSGIAACLVLFGAVGTTGYLMSRNPSDSGNEMSDEIGVFDDLTKYTFYMDEFGGEPYPAAKKAISDFFADRFKYEIDRNEVDIYEGAPELYRLTFSGESLPEDRISELVVYEKDFIGAHCFDAETGEEMWYYYKFDSAGFSRLIKSLLSSDCPFGDLSERDYVMTIGETTFMPSADSKERLRDVFGSIDWEPVDALSDSMRQDRYVIEFVDGSSERVIICSNGTVIYERQEDSIRYKVDFDTFDIAIMSAVKDDYVNAENPADLEPNCPIENAGSYSCFNYLSYEKQMDVTEFFNSQHYEEIDCDFRPFESKILIDGRSYKTGSTVDDYEELCFRISWDGMLNYYHITQKPGSDAVMDFSKVYMIDYDSFNEGLIGILFGEGLCGKNAPFADEDSYDWYFGGHEMQPARTLSHETIEELKSCFRAAYWIPIDRTDIDREEDAIELSHGGKKLRFSLDSGDAVVIDGDSKQYYHVVGSVLTDGYRNFIQWGESSYPAIGSLYKRSDDVYCESDAYTGKLSDRQLRNVSFALYNRAWREVENCDSLRCDNGSDVALYEFSTPADYKGIEEKWVVYADDTVEHLWYKFRQGVDTEPQYYVERYNKVSASYSLDELLEWALTH